MGPYHFTLAFLSFDGNVAGRIIPVSFVDMGTLNYLWMLGQ